MSLAWSNRNLSIGAMNAKNKVKGIKTLNQKDTSYLSSRLMDTRTGNSDFARTRAMSMTPVNANEFYDITSRTNALSKSALQLDKGAMESFNQKTKAAINAFAVSALHQDNRRIAVEKRFDMCSTYSSIIGAAVVYLISLSDDPNQALCSTYGVVGWDTIIWRASFILAGQFLVDWWFTTNQIAWGLPFAFTTQIQVTFVQGFMVASFAIAQSVTVLMAHERGLFGSCVPNKPAG